MDRATLPGVLKFRGKVDLWIGLVLLGAVLTPAAIGVMFHLPAMYIAAAAVGTLVAGYVWPQRYVLTESALVVRCGWSKRVIPYEHITDVQSCAPLRASVALSLDRLEITLHYRRSLALYVSPERPGSLRRS